MKSYKSSPDPQFRLMKNSFTGITLIYLLVMLGLTAVSVWLAVTFSPFWFIATLITGGYSAVLTIVMVVHRKMLNSVERDW
jgi:hypothetical protein